MGKNNKPSKVQNNSCDEELHGAARSGELKAVEAICSTNPLAVNSRDRHSRTALHLAAWSGHAEVVNYLCKNKADVGAAAMDDMGSIHFAAQKGHLEVIKILLASGVSLKSCNRKGMTALHYAAQGSNLELVKYLVKKGANIHTKNKAGKTSVDLASNEEIRQFLVEYKPDSVKTVLNDKVEQESSNTEKVEDVVALDRDETAENRKDESVKRKGEEEIKENQPGSKKSKITLNHLLAADDMPDEEV
ncbi:hypothetical protein ACJIZ3_004243 [Penstemon smallii]|uniref:Uncharacterized protein n=1 Tax=Penstemon smallii TaxID=265156 RepID=A0ABD3S1Q4_9LAMI